MSVLCMYVCADTNYHRRFGEYRLTDLNDSFSWGDVLISFWQKMDQSFWRYEAESAEN